MALQQSVAVRNAGLDAKETAIGTSPILKISNGRAARQLRGRPTAEACW